jgi:hypothetical protein
MTAVTVPMDDYRNEVPLSTRLGKALSPARSAGSMS